MKKYQLNTQRDESLDDVYNWPNERILWVRLLACVTTGGLLAAGIVAGMIRLANYFLE